MPDTKAGREKKGENKRAQLRKELTERELETLDSDEEPVPYAGADDDLLADELPSDE